MLNGNEFVTQRLKRKKKVFDPKSCNEDDLLNCGQIAIHSKESPSIQTFTESLKDLNLQASAYHKCEGNVSPVCLSFEDSDDERFAPTQHLIPPKPLKNCLIFVDVRAENENRSKAISRELERLGATISDKITSSMTHIVFKNGRNSTLTQLKKYPNIHFVSVLWVDSCKTTASRVSESIFPAKYPESYDSPLPIARSKRVKSLQPKTFEEELRNSAKKEDRKRRKLKKKPKIHETPLDQIICLDSQEYIKSSDLYKLVATPRAVPETPWIINYINGTQDDDQSLSQLDSCSKEVILNPASSKKNNTALDDLSQHVQCKLNFDAEVDAGERRSSCLIKLGSSPTSLGMNSPAKENINVVRFSRRSSTSRRRSARLMTSPLKNRKVDDDEPKQFKEKGLHFTKADASVDTSPSRISKVVEFDMSSVNKSGSEVENEGGGVQKKSSIAEFPKKKKKLLSKTKHCFPQEKLISPAVKSVTNAAKTTEADKKKHSNFKGTRYKGTVQNSGRDFDAHAAVLAVGNSKKQTNRAHVDAADMSTISFQNTKTKGKSNTSTANITADYTKLLTTIHDETVEDDNCENTQHRGSQYDRIDFNVIKSSRKYNVKKECVLNEKEQVFSDSSDASVSILKENEEPPLQVVPDRNVIARDTKGGTTISSVPIDEKYDDLASIADDPCGDLDGSFIHDENEGLICLSQEDIDAMLNDHQTESARDVMGNCNALTSDRENPEGVPAAPISPQEWSDVNASDAATCSGDDDSGISDSEECNLQNVDESQLSENYSCIETVTTSRNTSSLGKMDDASTSNACASAGNQKGKNSRKTVSAIKPRCWSKPVKKRMERSSCRKAVKAKVSLVPTSLHFGEQEFVRVMVKQLGGFTLRKNVSYDTTHMIAGSGRRTLNILHAMTQGCWILNPKWVADSVENGEWLEEGHYEMREEFPIAKRSRIARLRDGKPMHHNLFSQLPPIYLADVTIPPHEEIMKLITSCGGQLTTSLRKAGYGVGMISCRRKDLKIVSEKWILDSISKGRVMPVESYEIKLNAREPSPDY